MNRALVVVDDNAKALGLSEQADELAAGVEAELHVVRFVDRAEY